MCWFQFNYSLLDIPPVTETVSPVMYLASSEDKKETIPEQSSGSPILYE